MLRYLSSEWFDALNQAASSSAPLAHATAGLALTIQHEVAGGPHGDVTFHVTMDHGTVTFRPGPAADPDVVFHHDYATAAAIGRGESSAQVAFMVGKLRLTGRVERLVDEVAAFEQLNDVFESVRASTEY